MLELIALFKGSAPVPPNPPVVGDAAVDFVGEAVAAGLSPERAQELAEALS